MDKTLKAGVYKLVLTSDTTEKKEDIYITPSDYRRELRFKHNNENEESIHDALQYFRSSTKALTITDAGLR